MSARAEFLTGGGEMGERMRALDWSRTPLGPVEGWPQSLRSAVSMLLPSKAQICFFWGPEYVVLYNDAYRPVLGAKHPEMLGKPGRIAWSEIWDTSANLHGLLAGVVRTGEAFSARDMRFFLERHGFVEETYFDVSYDPVRIESGQVGGVFCIVTETTGRVVGERRLALLRDLADHNASARSPREACALAMETLRDRPDIRFALAYLDDELQACTPGAQDAYAAARPDLVHELPIGAGRLVVGLEPQRPFDEQYRSFLDLVAGQLTTAIANAQAYEDERKRAEALAELDRAKTAFFSNVSHEFRTPLTLMLGPLEETLADPQHPLPPAHRERQEVVRRNALRLLKMVNSLLDFSRIEAGRIQALYEPTDLGPYTAELASTFRSAIEAAGLRLTVDAPALAEPVYVDRGMWEKVVLNLLSNAFKFTLEGEITVALRRADRAVELEVRDTGSGIPAHELPHIFERFHRVEGTPGRSMEGTGIGLALVQELVQLHGGEIAVESGARGSVFRVRIPTGTAHLPADRVGTGRALAPAGEAATPYVEEALRWLPAERGDGDDAAARSASAPARELSGHARPRIVLADDNADMRDYLTRLLEPTYDVVAVGDGLAALAAVRARVPDLLLTDVMMPGLDGFGLLRALRADPATRELPILMLSARAGEEARLEGLSAGADDYLIKPFSSPELLARVRSQVELGRLRNAAARERDRLRALIGQAPAAINFLRGPDLVFEYVHPIAREVMGNRDVVGRPLLEALPELAEHEYPAQLRRVVETGEPIQGREKLVRHDDGNGGLRDSFWNFVYLPVRDEHGAVEGVMTFDVEVTDQVRARREVEAERARAEEANRVKSVFLASMSHELRTPLNAIIGYWDLLDSEVPGPLTKKQKDYLKHMERGARHLLRMIEEILTFSRLEAAREAVRLERCDLAQLMREATELLEPLARRKGLAFSCDVPEQLEARTDPSKVRQILLNLMSNAVKFTDAGSVSVHAWASDLDVHLRVRDTGIGLSAEQQAIVFEPFSQVEHASGRQRGGTGLGLTVTARLTELLGGEIALESELGQGSVFTVRLPRWLGDGDGALTGVEARHAWAGGAAGEGAQRPVER